MKKSICILLALLLLAGCAVPKQPEETKPAPTEASTAQTAVPTATGAEPEPPGPGLYELCSFTPGSGYRPVNLAARGREAVLLLQKDPADPERMTYYAQYLDLDTGEAGPIVPLERSEEIDNYGISLDTDGSLLYYTPDDEAAIRYDREGRMAGSESISRPGRDGAQFSHSMANQWFTYLDTAAWFHSWAEGSYLFTAYAFADEPDALYVAEGGGDAVRCAEGRRLLESAYLPGNAGLSFRLLDLESGKVLSRVTVENDAAGEALGRTFLNERIAALCETGAVLWVQRTAYEPGVEYGEGGPEPDWKECVYLWRPDETAAEPVSVRRFTEEELRLKNDELVARIREAYEIDVLLDKAPEGDRPPIMAGDDPEALKDAELVTGIETLPAYELLRQLEHFLQLLPPGFTHEMQTDYSVPESGYGQQGSAGFDIFIIKEIPGGSSAYANAWGVRMKIVLATDEFTPSTLPHEFMHLMEYRLTSYYDSFGGSLWKHWNDLNPEGFDYYDDDNSQDLVYDWFVSSYAMTNMAEDLAETFANVFMAQDPLEGCFWYRDAPHIQAKVAFLLETIRSSFPSVQAVDKAYWEAK